MRRVQKVAVLGLLLMIAAPLYAQDLASFEKNVTVRKLDNGLTVIIMERHEAPVFSYATVVNAGNAQEVPGITGLAHMFEHMAFKGSESLGTTNYEKEKAALQRVESAYGAYDLARRKTVGRDDAKVAQLEKVWKDAMDVAQKYVVSNEFAKVVDQAGGVGMNAFTRSDETVYFYSLPVNRFELWAYLDSERFLHPVFREFYKERDVVTEERRMRTESSPFGRLLEEFVTAAFTAHPYGFPTVGWPSDLKAFSATDAAAFFKKYYVPSNMVVAVEGYHRGAITDPDDPVYDVMEMLLSVGRTSHLYRSLVRDKKIASTAAGFSGFPGVKYPSLFTFYAVTTPGHTPQEVTAAIAEETNKLKTQDVSAEELQSVKTRVKAMLLRQLDNNSGLALQLALTQTEMGDWRELFRQLDRIDKVTAADVRRVADKTFSVNNRTIAYIDNSPAPTTAAKGGTQ